MNFKHRLWTDTETRSANDIKRGAYVYGEDSQPLLWLYALDEDPVKVWSPLEGQAFPRDLHEYLAEPTVEIMFHNKGFDRTQMRAWGLESRYPLDPMRFTCTMQIARTAGMPGGLDGWCQAVGVPEAYTKKDGNALIRFFCIPNKKTGRYNEPKDWPEQWAKFTEYGVYDVVAMREAYKRTPVTWSETERVLSSYTDLMNDRGVRLDVDLIDAAIAQAATFKARYRAHAKDLTADEGFNIVSQKAVLEYLKTYGVYLPDARAATLETFLESPDAEKVPTHLCQLLATRLKVNKASVAKYPAMRNGVSSDGRARGLTEFRGAGRTGRDAARRIQPQNLARPIIVGKKSKITKAVITSMEQAVDYVKKGMLDVLFDDPMQVLSDCVRGAIVASPGRKFCIADLSAIEGRKLAWLAQENDELNYYRGFDAGRIKYDTYQATYAASFSVDPATVTGDKRQTGKVQVLALGYEGGVGAFITFAAIYGIDLDQLARTVREVADPYLWKECEDKHQFAAKRNMTYGLEFATWVGCMYLVQAWRRSHPATVRSWRTAEDAFRNAYEFQGEIFQAAHKTYITCKNNWNFVQLPSGRILTYPHVHYAEGKGKGGKKQLAFWGVNPFTKKWGINYTYSGRLMENFTQASSNDVFMHALPAIEQAGYPAVLRVHDEYITEPEDRVEFSHQQLAKLMATPQHWCHDLPLAAAGFTTKRYQKID